MKYKKYMKRGSAFFVTREMQSETPLGYYFISKGMDKIKKVTTANNGKDMDQLNLSHTLLKETRNSTPTLENFWHFVIKLNIHQPFSPAVHSYWPLETP